MKQDRLSLTAGFMPAVIMALLLLLESLLLGNVLPRTLWVVAGAEVAAYLLPMVILRALPDSEGKRPLFRFRPYRRQTIGMVLWMSLMAALLGALLNGGTSLLLGSQREPVTSITGAYGVEGFWPAVLVIVVLPALLEELFFRGVMFSALERCGTWPALILTAVSFAMIHGDLHNFVGPLASGLIYGYLVYVLDSVWPALFAHLVNNALVLFLSYVTKAYSALGIWSFILLIAVFCFCMFLAFSMRALEQQIEKGRIKRLQYQGAAQTLNGIFVSPGIWLLLLLFAVRVLY